MPPSSCFRFFSAEIKVAFEPVRRWTIHFLLLLLLEKTTIDAVTDRKSADEVGSELKLDLLAPVAAN